MKVRQLLIALDQVLNSLLGGWADETVSARAYRNSGRSKRWAIARRTIDAIFFWQKEHCRGSYRMETTRMHLPPEYRDFIGMQK